MTHISAEMHSRCCTRSRSRSAYLVLVFPCCDRYYIARNMQAGAVDRALRWDEPRLLAHRPRLHTRRAIFGMIICPMDLRIPFLGRQTAWSLERDPADRLTCLTIIGRERMGRCGLVGGNSCAQGAVYLGPNRRQGPKCKWQYHYPPDRSTITKRKLIF